MEMADMLKSVLDNPDAMKKIMGMASAFASTAQPDPPPARPEPTKEEIRPVSSEKKQSGDEHRIMLIKALMPYLSPERRDAADAMIRIMKIMQLAELSSKGKGE